jgi:hypothetical protein
MHSDRKRSTEAEHEDHLCGTDDGDGAGQVLLPDALLQALERHQALRGEAHQHAVGRIRIPEPAVAAQARDALLVGGRNARNEARAEHLLDLAEAAIAQRIGEAHDRRGLHLGPACHLGDRAEGHLGRVLERELGDHLQAVREFAMPPGDLGAQLLVGIAGGRIAPARGPSRCPLHALALKGMWFVYFTSQVI